VEEHPVELTDEMVAAKWTEIAPLIDAMIGRIQAPNDFPVKPNSELARDDAVSTPYHVSHSARWCLNAGVEHLHALKSLFIDAGLIHSAASYSLVRGALENTCWSPTSWAATRSPTASSCRRWSTGGRGI
jgi:hypothetical protein